MTREEADRYLRILAICHYVLGGIAGLIACFPILHLVIGIVMTGAGLFGAASSDTNGAEFWPFPLMGAFFIVIAGTVILLGWTFAVCIVMAGRSLMLRKRYTFCLVMAAIACTFMPLGTVLGVFTIIVLMQPVVREMYGLPVAEPRPQP